MKWLIALVAIFLAVSAAGAVNHSLQPIRSSAAPTPPNARAPNDPGVSPSLEARVAGVADRRKAPDDTQAILGVWAGNLQKHLNFEAYLGREVRYTSQKIGDASWEHAKKVSLWISEQFAPVSDRVTLALIYNLLPKDGSTDFADVIDGSYDADLKTIARNLIGGGHGDAIIRLLHEADMPRRTWTFRNGNAEDYIAAWRHVHDVMMSVPGAAFRWQYSLNGPAGWQTRENGVYLTELGYPGDDYVDSVSVSNYDRGRYANDFETVREKLDFIRDFVASHGKKMDIAEWGLWSASNKGGGDNPTFIRDTLEWFQALPDEQRGYLLYFDLHKSVDLEQYPNSEALFLKLFGPKTDSDLGAAATTPEKG